MVLVFIGFMAGYNHFGGSLLMGSMGLLATIFYTFLPCFLFILVGAPLVERTKSNRRVKAVLGLVTAAVVGGLNLTVYLGQAVIFGAGGRGLTIIDYFSLGWVLLSIVAMHRFKVGMIPWITISALAGFLKFMSG